MQRKIDHAGLAYAKYGKKYWTTAIMSKGCMLQIVHGGSSVDDMSVGKCSYVDISRFWKGIRIQIILNPDD